MAPASASSTTLHLTSTRRSTYKKARKGAQRPLNWPHPLTASKSSPSSIHPDHLAAAGFYSTPTAEEPTRSTCFSCSAVVEVWTEGDDPIATHVEISPSCGWALLKLLLTSWPDGVREKKEWDAAWGQGGDLWPRSERVESARLASFGTGWPHDGEEGVPSTNEIAAAGWFFRPGASADSEDNCVCPYCTRTVEGWEAGDDPIALHKRKLGLKCPFFLSTEPPQRLSNAAGKTIENAVQEEESAPTSKSKMSRSKGRQKLAEAAEVESAADHGEDVEEVEQSQPTRASRRTTAASRVASSPAPEPVAKPTRATRGGKKNATTAAVNESIAEDDESASAPNSKRSVQVEVVIDVKGAKKGRATRGKKAATAIEPEVDDTTEDVEEGPAVEGDVEEVAQEEEPAAAPVTKKKPSTGKKAGGAKRSTKASASEVGLKEGRTSDESLIDAARVAEDFLDQDGDVDGMAVDAEVVESSQPTAAAKPKSNKSKKNNSTSVEPSKPLSAPALVPPPAAIRQPLTPTVASPSPRLIRSLPSKVNSPVTKSAPVFPSPPKSSASSIERAAADPTPPPSSALPLTSLYAPLPNPFSATSAMPAPTATELQLPLSEWYDLQGRLVYEAMQREMERELKGVEDRIELGRRELGKMVAAAERREKASKGVR